ncbi:MAG: L,D-transpeptidase [Candidatus Dormibacteraeota bacterium]|uniref:L,D-transpeptidase n=1 Tax=Candidatus Amunia macphersoniae TaxID=3127014 RepID=A0A934NFV6_9BACT|nr:L,D-transpeptidase [Candidatus Dormibacteraeota bacterium]
MRSLLVALSAACCVMATACASTSAPTAARTTVPANNATRQASFVSQAHQLTAAWDQDVAQGVPAASLVPLRQQLTASPYQTAPASSSVWNSNGGSRLLTSLTDQTTIAWIAAVDASRQRASAVLDRWTAVVTQYASYVPGDATNAAAAWPAQLAAAYAPAEIDKLGTSWSTTVDAVQQTASVNRAHGVVLQPYSSVSQLISVADGAAATARADGLNDPDVPALLSALQAAAAGGGFPEAAIRALQSPLRTLRELINQENGVAAALAGLQRDIGAAAALNTTNAASFPAQYGDIAAAFHAASDSPSLGAVAARIAALDSTVNADPAANGCGRGAAGGKVITISLSQQRVVFSQDGCTVRTSLVTTGRDQLRTPTGTFHIFSKATHFTFISPWPKGSPFYYYPSVANYAMGFAGGGYYIHDAPWEPDSAFGPGSQNSSNASHGCVHIESSVMPWLYGWADMGTTVVITG